jgi:hypothetical protein
LPESLLSALGGKDKDEATLEMHSPISEKGFGIKFGNLDWPRAFQGFLFR